MNLDIISGNQVKYIVSFPIYGYNGGGYSGINRINHPFVDEGKARKYFNRMMKVWMIDEDLRLRQIAFMTDTQASFVHEMTDQGSYTLRGAPKLTKLEISVKETVLEGE